MGALSFLNGAKDSSGILESFIASLIFFSPNFLLFFSFFRNNLVVFLFYDYIVIFLIVSALMHVKFKKV